MSKRAPQYRGYMGAAEAEKKIPKVLGQCIALLRPLPGPYRNRILKGIQAYLLEDACSEGTSELP